MAPIGEEEDTSWPCELCQDIIFEPVTLPCCGRSFCMSCLRQWIISKARQKISDARCPSTGCEAPLPKRLPAVSRMLSETIAALAPEEIQRRREAEDEEAAEAEPIPGGFHVWQEVVASQDLYIGDSKVAEFGMTGLVLSAAEEPDRVSVKFDDPRAVFLNVTPGEITAQLEPRLGVLISQRVAATTDLTVGPTIAVRFGTQGTVLGKCANCAEERITVQFDGRAGILSVQSFEITPYRMYVGGFFIANRVQASKDLYSGDTLLVRSGTTGTVKNEYSDTRLTVQFDIREDGQLYALNVTTEEIKSL